MKNTKLVPGMILILIIALSMIYIPRPTAEEPTNLPPHIPEKPIGTTLQEPEKNCFFVTTTTDPENDFIHYMWDWGDGTHSQWIGLYSSGIPAGISHQWHNEGTYQVRVKATDIIRAIDDWSEPLTVTIRYLRGDMNGDGDVNNCDINLFVLALANPQLFIQQYGNAAYLRGDCNYDGNVNFGDINPFIQILTGGC